MLSSLIYPSNFTATSSTLVSKCCIRLPVNNSIVSKRNFQLPAVAHLPCNSIRIPSSGTIDSHDDFWLHEIELEVRDYELDQYGVVNNATYANYCEHALARGLEKVSKAGGDTGGAIALINLSLNFIAPLRRRDKFLIKHRVTKWSRTRLFIEHFIVKLHKQEPIMKASATAIWLDEMYRPLRIPPDVLSYICNQQAGTRIVRINHVVILKISPD